MTTTPIVTILMVDDDETEFHLVSEFLKERATEFRLLWVDTLEKGMAAVTSDKPDVVLLDLHMADSQGLDTFKRMKGHAKNVPIIILSGLNDEQSAIDAIQMGAQDFLVKDHVTGERLSRVVKFAITRHERQQNPKNTGLVDPLTGLFNRDGFLSAAEAFLKTIQRTETEFFLCCAVLNNYGRIKEVYGTGESERSLITMTEIFRETFRSSDIIARIGDDKFAILATAQPNHNAKTVSALIQQNQKFYNAQFNRYTLALSISSHQFSPRENLSVATLAAKMDSIFDAYKGKQTLVEN